MPIPLPLATDESTRLAVLHALCLLDSPPDPAFDALAALAAESLGVEMALVSLVDEHRQWFKTRVGIQVQETPREQAFCAHALSSRQVLVIPDATQDERFRDNPSVLGPPHIRFYAGAPLWLNDDQCIGTLCVMGTKPRGDLNPLERMQLEAIRDLVVLRIEHLRSDGYWDAVTGLPNRARFNKDLELWLANPADTSANIAIAVDVCGNDYFRDMVKALGWEYGDGYMEAAKQRLRTTLEAIGHANIVLYRLDHTTFGFLLPLLSKEEGPLSQICEDVIAAFNASLDHQGIPHTATASLGVVALDTSYGAGDTTRSLTTAVDVARQRGQPWILYERRHDAVQRTTFRLLASLPAALESMDQLHLHYQPRVNLQDHHCVAVEALLRWRHPQSGPVMPSAFIPMAEKTALINRITAWVIEHGVAQAARWQREGHTFNLALNVSAADIDQPNFAKLLRDALERHRLDPQKLEIEFTESAMIRNPERLAEQLEAIHALGVRIAIDDFGTGYSNFSYLKQLPASALKIDQSFVRSLPDNHADRTIVPAMIKLSHNLGQRVVAEGIESEAVYRQLRDWGCDEGQGYWIAKPMTAAMLNTWLKTPWQDR